MPTDILTVLLRISTVASRLQYGLNHAHINRSGDTEVLNSLKLPWSFPDQHGSSRTTTNHDGLVDGATTVLSRITTVHHDSSNRSEPWSEPWMCKRALSNTNGLRLHGCADWSEFSEVHMWFHRAPAQTSHSDWLTDVLSLNFINFRFFAVRLKTHWVLTYP